MGRWKTAARVVVGGALFMTLAAPGCPSQAEIEDQINKGWNECKTSAGVDDHADRICRTGGNDLGTDWNGTGGSLQCPTTNGPLVEAPASVLVLGQFDAGALIKIWGEFEDVGPKIGADTEVQITCTKSSLSITHNHTEKTGEITDPRDFVRAVVHVSGDVLFKVGAGVSIKPAAKVGAFARLKVLRALDFCVKGTHNGDNASLLCKTQDVGWSGRLQTLMERMASTGGGAGSAAGSGAGSGLVPVPGPPLGSAVPLQPVPGEHPHEEVPHAGSDH